MGQMAPQLLRASWIHIAPLLAQMVFLDGLLLVLAMLTHLPKTEIPWSQMKLVLIVGFYLSSFASRVCNANLPLFSAL